MGFFQTAYVINQNDNVATALCLIKPGNITLTGEAQVESAEALENIPIGHKLSIGNIRTGDNIIKYGVVIGRATKDISQGQWVHLHCMISLYDERSSHLDINTGVPSDIRYE